MLKKTVKLVKLYNKFAILLKKINNYLTKLI